MATLSALSGAAQSLSGTGANASLADVTKLAEGFVTAFNAARRVVHGVRVAHNLRPVFCATAYTDGAAAAPRPGVPPGLARLSAGAPLVLRAGASPP
jgi:hypothetical protein